jgi:hypothetical protein
MVQVTDAHSCTANGSVNILSSIDSVVIDTAVVEATCGLANGSITITPSGGSVPYQFVWSTGLTAQTLSGVNGGSYIVTVSDHAGCFSSKSITVLQYPALVYTVITQNDTLAAHRWERHPSRSHRVLRRTLICGREVRLRLL